MPSVKTTEPVDVGAYPVEGEVDSPTQPATDVLEPATTAYREYTIEIPTKSLGPQDVQRTVFQLLSKTSSHLDPIYRNDYGDQQVISIRIVWQRPEKDIDDIQNLVEELGGRVDVNDPLI